MNLNLIRGSLQGKCHSTLARVHSSCRYLQNCQDLLAVVVLQRKRQHPNLDMLVTIHLRGVQLRAITPCTFVLQHRGPRKRPLQAMKSCLLLWWFAVLLMMAPNSKGMAETAVKESATRAMSFILGVDGD